MIAALIAMLIVAAVGATSLANGANNNTSSILHPQSRHCAADKNCIVGNSVELSKEKWKCIGTVLDDEFGEAINNSNPNAPAYLRSFGKSVTVLATVMKLMTCLNANV